MWNQKSSLLKGERNGHSDIQSNLLYTSNHLRSLKGLIERYNTLHKRKRFHTRT